MSYRRPLCEVSVLGSICPVGLGPGDIPTLSSPRWVWGSGGPRCVPAPSPKTKSVWRFVTTLPHQGAWALPP